MSKRTKKFDMCFKKEENQRKNERKKSEKTPNKTNAKTVETQTENKYSAYLISRLSYSLGLLN